MLSSLIDMARSRLAGRSCTTPTMMENMNAASRARHGRRLFLPLERQWTYLGTASSWLSASWTPIRYLSLLCLSGALQWSTPLYPGKPFRFQYHTCCPEMPDTRPNLKVEHALALSPTL